MAIRDYLPIQTNPAVVDRAPRRERWKRQVWMVGSTVIAFTTAYGLAWTVAFWVPWFPPTGYAGIATAVGVVLVAGYVDVRLFAWGVEAFELVAPWQFREADIDDSEDCP